MLKTRFLKEAGFLFVWTFVLWLTRAGSIFTRHFDSGLLQQRNAAFENFFGACEKGDVEHINIDIGL